MIVCYYVKTINLYYIVIRSFANSSFESLISFIFMGILWAIIVDNKWAHCIIY